MPLVGEMVDRLQKIDIEKILDEALKELEKFIIELNQEQLYEKGEIDVNKPGYRDPKGYSPRTIKQKQKKAKFKKTEFVTLRWDGTLYESFKLIIFKEVFLISARDLKWNYLGENPRFENALGLTEESKNELKAEILPVILQKIRNVI